MDKQQFFSRLEQVCAELELDLKPEQAQQLHDYWALFLKWNASYNLSAIRDGEGIFYKHIVDSLSVVKLFKLKGGQRNIDVGTGGGLPGIVLAICFPERHFSLLDSAGKKMRFLFQVKQSLSLDNVELHNCRVEQHQPDPGYDLVISRAFTSVANFSSWCKHLLKPGGEFWAMKGQYPDAELSEMETCYIVSEHHELVAPGVEGERCLLILKLRD
ncbi:16S rRNA (guanine(527)-N(7))-methyltransferase RsmG [Agaribacterium haliotis]|uniref:16S rRNA (guanine(527)-N(7))-methyltransferase RsmG n=1 Tax=Agaribacterium haliotis TaxID=2013869 RepID=UPI000BB594FB|nr:16S rRNA (guanine(527)-N(7))-methyltransferase RsmG [Agaribacterium haliotis]